MALVGYEVIAVIAILLVIFLWGPKKLPEIARSIGLAKHEFGNTAKQLSTLEISPPAHQSAEDPLLVAARSLNITIEGKTKEELAKEIAARSAK